MAHLLPPDTDKVALTLARNKELKKIKELWKVHWQLLGEYIMTRKQDFTAVHQAGDFLTRDTFDSSASKANNVMSSSLVSMLWPNGAKSFRLRPPAGVTESVEVKKYFETGSTRMAEAMDDPNAGLPSALDEYMKDQGAFGTSAIDIQEGDDIPVMFRALSVKEISIDEGKDGRVDTVYIEREWTIRQLVMEYGLENVSKKSREKFENGKFGEKVVVLIAIEPRLDTVLNKEGNLNMPIQSLHIEMKGGSGEGAKLLKESGFEELSIKVGRFWKLITEKYGRSPGMEALPDILELNAVWEAVTVAIEKTLDPPMGILDDGRLGNSTIDTSAGAINVFNITGRAGEKQPVFPLFTVKEFQHITALIEKLTDSIGSHFFIDRLLDLNNETQMTLGEAQIRNRLRGFTLGGLFARQVAELFNPLIERVFNILQRRGVMGVIAGSEEHNNALLDGEDPLIIPDVIAERMLTGQDVYRIQYITPAARIMETEEAQGIVQTWEMATVISGTQPEVIDNLDADESIRAFSLNAGAPGKILKAKELVEQIRKARAEAQQKAQELEAARVAASAAKDANAAGVLKPEDASGRS